MTENKQEKRAARALASKMGISYTAALREVRDQRDECPLHNCDDRPNGDLTCPGCIWQSQRPTIPKISTKEHDDGED